MDREQIIERLRLWASRAQHEAQMADTRDDILNWQGQAQVLSAVATFLDGPGAEMSASDAWRQIAGDRSAALAAWERAQEGPEAMLYAGVVGGYDIVATLLTDVAGRSWTIETRIKSWVNR